MKDPIEVKKVEVKKVTRNHIKPVQSADALFNFMDQYQYLENILKNKMISPRYCKEDFSYLNIKGLNELAFPMRCFCDINFHMLDDHIGWYGDYAIAFSKDFGIRKGIQPVTYINSESEVAKDYGISFEAALSSGIKEDKVVKMTKNYLLHQLMYTKPIQGMTHHHRDNEDKIKCLMDENEWRFVANVKMYGMKQVIKEQSELNKNVLIRESNALDGQADCSLQFEYEDIKYIIISDSSDLEKLSKMIDSLNMDFNLSSKIMSKVIVWNEWKGDF